MHFFLTQPHMKSITNLLIQTIVFVSVIHFNHNFIPVHLNYLRCWTSRIHFLGKIKLLMKLHFFQIVSEPHSHSIKNMRLQKYKRWYISRECDSNSQFSQKLYQLILVSVVRFIFCRFFVLLRSNKKLRHVAKLIAYRKFYRKVFTFLIDVTF